MDVVRTIGLAVCALVIFLQVEQLGKRPQFMDRRERKRLAKKKRRAVRRLMVCVVVGVALVMGPETFGKMIPQTITVAEGLTLPKGEMPDWLVYYNQQDEPWGQKGYGPSDTIAVAGCGPTVLAMAVSSLTETDMNPEDMSNWAAEHGYCVPGSGSLHTLIGDGLDAFGIAYHTGNGQEASQALSEGHPVIALMGPGHFTTSGHFILLCDWAEDGTVFVADPAHRENMKYRWPMDLICSEAKASSVTGAAFWILDVTVEQS